MAISKVNAKIIEEAEKSKMFLNVLKNSDSPVQNSNDNEAAEK